MTRVVFNTTNGKDMKAIEQSAACIAPIKEQLSNFKSQELSDCFERLDALSDIEEYISATIVDDPPFSVREGRMIKKGFSEELDELRSMEENGQEWMAKIEKSEKELTGIKTLKVGFNKVFGYYIEVSNSFKDMVPERYIRKQTLTGGERYITE